MIKVTTQHGTQYLINEEDKQIKRIPRPGSELNSWARGFINIGDWQPYTSFSGLEVGDCLYVQYPNEQQWSRSTLITEIDNDFQE